MGSFTSKLRSVPPPLPATLDKESLLSILCNEAWLYDCEHWNQITFHRDGTGRLISSSENSLFIAGEIEWKLLGQETSIDRPAEGDSGSPTETVDTDQFDIEMTLTTRTWEKPPFDWSRYRINERALTDAAFLPKKYTLGLSRGRYRTYYGQTGPPPPLTPFYAYRLSFDRSPYPPREEWKEVCGVIPDIFKFWEWKVFCSHPL